MHIHTYLDAYLVQRVTDNPAECDYCSTLAREQARAEQAAADEPAKITAYLAPLTGDELAILGEKLHRAVVKTSVSHVPSGPTHVLVTEVYDDTLDEQADRRRKATPMPIHLIYNPNREGAEVRVHKAGCRDIPRDLRGSTSNYTTEATSQREAAEDFWADFIEEGSMDLQAAAGYTVFLPCTLGLAGGWEAGE
jgi:hypothetical protein